MCFTFTMHRYINWLLNKHYQPLLTAQHLRRRDMMNTWTGNERPLGIRQLKFRNLKNTDSELGWSTDFCFEGLPSTSLGQ